MSVDPGIDLARVREELEAEVRARRAAGELPPAFERELDAAFARHAPIGASEDLEAVLEATEEAAAIDAAAPVASRKPAGRLMKQAIARGMGWYQAWIAHQVTVFAATSARASRLLARRVEALESAVATGARARRELAHLDPPATPAAALDPVCEALQGTDGRILVAEAGDGAVLAALVATGLDAYGVEPRAAQAGLLADRALEVRADPALVHLHRVPEGALGAVVLHGAVHRLAPGEQVELCDLVVERLRPAGRLVVVGVEPAAWAAADPVAADLAVGHPLRRPTWEHLVRVRGLDVLASSELGLPEGSGGGWLLVARLPVAR